MKEHNADLTGAQPEIAAETFINPKVAEGIRALTEQTRRVQESLLHSCSPVLTMQPQFQAIQRSLAPCMAIRESLDSVQRLGEMIQRSFVPLQQMAGVRIPIVTDQLARIRIPTMGDWAPQITSFNATVRQFVAPVIVSVHRIQEVARSFDPHTIELLPAYLAHRAMEEDDGPSVRVFFFHWLNIPHPQPEHYEALWTVLRSKRWQSARKPIAYIKKAVWYQSKRFRDHEEMKNRLFWEDKSALDIPVSADDDRSLVNLLPGTNNTLEAEDLADMLMLLEALTPQDRRTALLLWAGFQPMEVFDGINAWVVAKRRMRRHLISRFPELGRN